jgi:hypothetical protein
MDSGVRGTFLDSLDEVSGDEILVDESPEGLRREALTNLWAFSVTQQHAEQLVVAQVLRFIQIVVEARAERLAKRCSTSHHVWCDEQASQLRFSLVSARHGQLPFGFPVTVVPGQLRIIESFLNLPYHDGIPLDTADDTEVEDSIEQPLEVWSRLIPDAQTHTSATTQAIRVAGFHTLPRTAIDGAIMRPR